MMNLDSDGGGSNHVPVCAVEHEILKRDIEYLVLIRSNMKCNPIEKSQALNTNIAAIP